MVQKRNNIDSIKLSPYYGLYSPVSHPLLFGLSQPSQPDTLTSYGNNAPFLFSHRTQYIYIYTYTQHRANFTSRKVGLSPNGGSVHYLCVPSIFVVVVVTVFFFVSSRLRKGLGDVILPLMQKVIFIWREPASTARNFHGPSNERRWRRVTAYTGFLFFLPFFVFLFSIKQTELVYVENMHNYNLCILKHLFQIKAKLIKPFMDISIHT